MVIDLGIYTLKSIRIAMGVNAERSDDDKGSSDEGFQGVFPSLTASVLYFIPLPASCRLLLGLAGCSCNAFG